MSVRTYADTLASDIESLSGNAPKAWSPYGLDPMVSVPKRRKTEGLNARFDRMIETVNVVHRSSVDAIKQSRRRRAASSASGSSSTASYDIPKTPVDTYLGHHEGRFGQNVSLATKTQRSSPEWDAAASFFGSSSVAHKEPVPDWLCETVSTLNSDHPLRAMIPLPHIINQTLQSPFRAESHALSGPESIPRNAEMDDHIFAFRPPAASHPSQPHPHHETIMSPYTSGLDVAGTDRFEPSLNTDMPYLVAAKNVLENSLDARTFIPAPFTTPGPVSALSSFSTPLALPHALDLETLKSPGLLWYQKEHPDVKPFSVPGPVVSTIPASPIIANSRIQPQSTPSVHSTRFLDRSFDWVPDQDSDPEQYSLSDILRSSSPAPLPIDVSRSPSPNARALASQNDYPADGPGSVYACTLNRKESPNASSNGGNAFPSQLHTPISPGAPLVTPHPPRAPAFKVYFDDPVEDPSDPSSDSLERSNYELDLDYGSLDFKWKRFDPAGLPEEVGIHTDAPMNFWARQAEESDDPNHVGMERPLPVSPRTPDRTCVVASPSGERPFTANDASSSQFDIERLERSDVSWILPLHGAKAIKSRNQAHIPTRDDMDEISQGGDDRRKSVKIIEFAPAPGIYVSPLRNQKGRDGIEPQTVSRSVEDAPSKTVEDASVSKDPCTPIQRVRPTSDLSVADRSRKTVSNSNKITLHSAAQQSEVGQGKQRDLKDENKNGVDDPIEEIPLPPSVGVILSTSCVQ
ncbi:unnamed protein product [Somion occarium]|uniref:Uncharacterized protein n=1 Tax=Somion occarium TaxID=3059160 RepID=A0ABP1DIL2_9APHY